VRHLMLTRGRDATDFTERDRLLIRLIRPHVDQAWHAERRRQRGPAQLTRREREIMRYVAEGCSTAAISHRLGTSPATVNRHLANAYRKLGVHSRTAAVAATFGAE